MVWKQNESVNLSKIKSLKLSTYKKRSIFWNIFKTVDEYKLLQYTNFYSFNEYTQYYRLSKYLYPPISLPINLNITNNPHSEMNISVSDDPQLYIYTDGSVQQGLGGYGIYFEKIYQNQFKQIYYEKVDEITKFVGVTTDINYVELLATYNAITCLINHRIYQQHIYQQIFNVTDSRESVDWIAGYISINHQYIYTLITKMYKCIKKLFDDFNYKVNIQWCKGHLWRGNIVADKLADQSIKMIQDRCQDISQIKSTTPSSIRSVKNIFKRNIYNHFKKTQLNNSHIISNMLVYGIYFKNTASIGLWLI